MIQIHHGDALILPYPDDHFDCLVTDPPYGYGFMGKDWDKAVVPASTWNEVLRVMKPGAFGFVMSAPRQDVLARMIVNLQEAGFETGFTSIYWAYATGFPKAGNIGKMVDKRLGVEREVVGVSHTGSGPSQIKLANHGPGDTGIGIMDGSGKVFNLTSPASPLAKSLDGAYAGFQPKPAVENILCVQKPLTIFDELTIITSQAIKLMEVISCQSVNFAQESFSQVQIVGEYIAQRPAMAEIVQEAIARIGRVADHSGQMAISKSILGELMEKPDMNLNTDSLWKSILADLLRQTNSLTTEMARGLIIELKILNSLLSQTIQESITQAETGESGPWFNVGVVESILKSVIIRLLSLKSTSALLTAGESLSTGNGPQPANNAELDLRSEARESPENTAPNGVTTRVVLVVMKPLTERTYLDQAMKDGKGVTWLEAGRIPFDGPGDVLTPQPQGSMPQPMDWGKDSKNRLTGGSPQGRFPANLLVSDDVLDDGRVTKSAGGVNEGKLGQRVYGDFGNKRPGSNAGGCGDTGTFSRYFDLDAWWEALPESARKTFPFLIVPKASKAEKNRGCERMNEKPIAYSEYRENVATTKSYVSEYPDGTPRPMNKMKNSHPTVKPVKLMSYLIAIGSRAGDIILDPFMGSGTTLVAAKGMGRRAVGVDNDPECIPVAQARVKAVNRGLF